MTSTSAQPVPFLHGTMKRRTALASVAAAAVITVLKLLAAIVSHSIGMYSEAAHSALDLLASAITLMSVMFSGRPADENHPYGHEKIENLAAFTETLLMLGSVLWIVTESIHRIFEPNAVVHISPWPFAVLLLSMAVDFLRSKSLAQTASDTGSAALEADAVHFGTDIWSSFAVIAGLVCILLSRHLHLRWLRLGDPLAAILVSAIILKVCWGLTRKAIDVLIDTAPTDLHRRIFEAVSRTDGILALERLRLRTSGNHYFVDLKLAMPRNISFQRSEAIKEAAAAAVHSILPEADVLTYAVPRASSEEDIFDRVRAVAANSNLSVHDVSVQDWRGLLHLEQHLEVPETLTLRAAHDLATKIEADIRAEIPEIQTILTHIESEHSTIERDAQRTSDRALEVHLREIANRMPEIVDVHDVTMKRLGGALQVTCHCTLNDETPMSVVHAVITRLEDAVKADLPQVARVFIHPEPCSDNRR
jgi:cation diffusion facilitator family transporter